MSLQAINVTEAVTPLLPAVTSRQKATIFNDGFSTVFVKWDASATALTAANGEVLPPKCRMVIDSVAAVTGITAPGATSTVRVQDESVA